MDIWVYRYLGICILWYRSIYVYGHEDIKMYIDKVIEIGVNR